MTAINSLASSFSPAASTPNRLNELSSDEFIKIMITELSNQDPFEPSDSSAILDQLSSIRNIESQQLLQDQLKSLVNQNAITSAGGFLGKPVTGLDTFNNAVSGIVTSLRIENGKPILVLDSGETVAADRLLTVGQGQSTVSGVNPPVGLPGDATGDGQVTGSDWLAVLKNFGDTTGERSSTALGDQTVLNSAALLGKLVGGTGADGQKVEGIVSFIRVEDSGRIVLELDTGKILSAAEVEHVGVAAGKATTAG